MWFAITWDVTPEILPFSPVPRWYGLLFAAGIIGAYMMGRSIFLREGKPLEVLDRLLVYVFIGTLIGMRLGHCLFYQPEFYLSHPHRILMIWEGGYASHGGFLGVIVALLLFGRKHKELSFLWMADRAAFATMFTAGCIRIGNFFNSEILGYPSNVPWAVIFANVDSVPRHPAQIYEAIGYFAICAIGYLLYRRTRLLRTPGRLLGVVMILGFSWRFVVEFFKLDQVAFEEGMALNMGQILSLPFIAMGLFFALGAHRRLFFGVERSSPSRER